MCNEFCGCVSVLEGTSHFDDTQNITEEEKERKGSTFGRNGREVKDN